MKFIIINSLGDGVEYRDSNELTIKTNGFDNIHCVKCDSYINCEECMIKALNGDEQIQSRDILFNYCKCKRILVPSNYITDFNTKIITVYGYEVCFRSILLHNEYNLEFSEKYGWRIWYELNKIKINNLELNTVLAMSEVAVDFLIKKYLNLQILN